LFRLFGDGNSPVKTLSASVKTPFGPMMLHPSISLLTDFGLRDTFVGQMKGVIVGINPDARVVDLTHDIGPQQVVQAAVAIADAIEAFPPGTIHVAVVDPGVGSARRAIAAEIGDYRFVCPDNGLLTLVLRRAPLKRAVELNERRWFRPIVSNTFHGRDIFAPVAAAWSLGHDLEVFGTAITSPLIELAIPAVALESGAVHGEVLTVDRFGNLITNIERRSIPDDARDMEVCLAGQRLAALHRCFADRPTGECVAFAGSAGRVEIAVVNGNAARQLRAGIGEPVTIRWQESIR
jgi:S-adenosyl-L-methionine hydrolase (adenosine-forming)